jgi:hypothetical protein
MLLSVLAAPCLALAICAPALHPIIGEIFYDAAGDDTGFEFVEIFNPLATPYPLAGVRLEAGDGAGAGRWTLRWVGGALDTLRGHARLVIGGAHVVPAPEAVANLELQNGPDAVRLVWPDGATEVVGYGAHTLPEYSCGAAAVDVPAGFSLARIPDDSDRGSNAQDFSAATPSPGAANRPGRDAALVAGSLAVSPDQPPADHPAAVSGVVGNRGGESISEHEIEVRAEESGVAGDPSGGPVPGTPLGSVFVDRALAPGDTAAFTIPVGGLAAGKRMLRGRARLAGDEAPANDTDSLVIRVGLGPLEITEIQFHPGAGEGEWVEVRNRSGSPLPIAAFTLSDRRGAPGRPLGGSDPLAAESLAVLAQDRDALRARFPALDASRVWSVSPWASLNNSDDSTGVADIVTLREADGTPCERVSYSAHGVPSGVPIERIARDDWRPSIDPLGRPLAPPRSLPPLPRHFSVTPRRLRAAGGAATIGWELPWPRGRIVVDLYDLAGRRVAHVLQEASVAARGERSWNAAGVAPGVYVLALLAHAEGGPGSLAASQPVRIEGSVP